jgi:hypothetical protein
MGVPVKQRLDFDMFGDGSLWKGLLQNYPLTEEIQDFCKVAKVIFGEQLIIADKPSSVILEYSHQSNLPSV